MGDLEARLRAELTQRAEAFSPSPDLGDRIGARVRARRRRQQALVGVLSCALVAVAAGVMLVRPSDEDTVSVRSDGNAPTTASPARPSISAATPLSRWGIGPIRAGMTLREAEAAADVTVVPGPAMGPRSTCGTARLEGLDLWFIVVLSGEPSEDLMDGVIGSVQGGRRTVEGVALGDPVAELDRVYGPPTRTLDHPYPPGDRVLVYEADGFAYSATTDGATVIELESGDPARVANLEGCS